jgi:hypothetical protein
VVAFIHPKHVVADNETKLQANCHSKRVTYSCTE